ncbi:MAG: TetR/AcrR family transcriptional regulator [Gaiella sp.]
MKAELSLTEHGAAAGSARRLPAPERRAALVRAALAVFASTSYARATTVEIARAAGVSEPILYRHFPSKRELWFACLDAAWADVRIVIEEKVRLLVDGAVVPEVELRSPWQSPLMPNLWLQGIAEAGDPAIHDRVRNHMGEVHDFVTELFRSLQHGGAMPTDRDPSAEAWIFVSGGLLRSVADRLGGVLSTADLAAIGRERRRWLCGS